MSRRQHNLLLGSLGLVGFLLLLAACVAARPRPPAPAIIWPSVTPAPIRGPLIQEQGAGTPIPSRNIIIPLYAYPQKWVGAPAPDTWTLAAQANISGTIMIVIDPICNSWGAGKGGGPTCGKRPFEGAPRPGAGVPDSNYLAGMTELSGTLQLGYVSTYFGGQTIADIEGQIDIYATAPYTDYIDGIFFDEVRHYADTWLTYYTEIANYAYAQGMTYVVLNMDGWADNAENFFNPPIANLAIMFEGYATDWDTYLSPFGIPPDWLQNYDRSNFAAVVLNVPGYDLPRRLEEAYQRNYGVIFVHSAASYQAAYDTSPPYLLEEINTWNAYVGGTLTPLPTPLPSATPTATATPYSTTWWLAGNVQNPPGWNQPVIDGQVSEWQTSNLVPLRLDYTTAACNSGVTALTDVTGALWAAYDSTYLYLAVQIDDDHLFTQTLSTDWWLAADAAIVAWTGPATITVPLTGNWLATGAVTYSTTLTTSLITVARWYSETLATTGYAAYQMEARIPLTLTGSPVAGDLLRAFVRITDNDGGIKYLKWQSPAGCTTYTPPDATWGYLKLDPATTYTYCPLCAPTLTPAGVATATPTPTAPYVGPTWTPSHTPTRTPTATPSPTPLYTIPPTYTATATATPPPTSVPSTPTPSFFWDDMEGTPPGKWQYDQNYPTVTPTYWPTVVANSTQFVDGSQSYQVAGVNCSGIGCVAQGGLHYALPVTSTIGFFGTRVNVFNWNDWPGQGGFTAARGKGTRNGVLLDFWKLHLNKDSDGFARLDVSNSAYSSCTPSCSITLTTVTTNTWYAATLGWQIGATTSIFTLTWGATTGVITGTNSGTLSAISAVDIGVYTDYIYGAKPQAAFDAVFLTTEHSQTTPTPMPTATPTATATWTPTPTRVYTTYLYTATPDPAWTPAPGTTTWGGCWLPDPYLGCAAPPIPANTGLNGAFSYYAYGITWPLAEYTIEFCTTGATAAWLSDAWTNGWSNGVGGGAYGGDAGVVNGLALDSQPNYRQPAQHSGGIQLTPPPLGNINTLWDTLTYGYAGPLAPGVYTLQSVGGVAACFGGGPPCLTDLDLGWVVSCPGVTIPVPTASATPAITPAATRTPFTYTVEPPVEATPTPAIWPAVNPLTPTPTPVPNADIIITEVYANSGTRCWPYDVSFGSAFNRARATPCPDPFGRATAGALVCADFNGRSGCGANDQFIEFFSARAVPWADYLLTYGTCRFILSKDSFINNFKVAWQDEMTGCTTLPTSGTAYLYRADGTLADSRVVVTTEVGLSWAAAQATVYGSPWGAHFPSPGR